VGYASTGQPCAHARRRRQAPHPRRVRSHKACIRQVSRPQCRRTPTTTHRPARACNMHYAIKFRAGPGRDARRGDEAATRGPDGIHGCDPRPSARIVGGDVRYWTGVRSPTPSSTKCYAPTSDEFKEMIAIYLGAPSPLATQIGVGRRVRCPNKNRANLTLDKWGLALL